MQFDDSDLAKAVACGLSASEPGTRAQARNVDLEQGVSDTRRIFFETETFSISGSAWTDLDKRHRDYVRYFVETDAAQPHTFQDALHPNDAGAIDGQQRIVRLESLTRPMTAFGCTFDQLRDAHEENDVDFLSEFCDVWNAKRDLRPAFSTLLSEVAGDVARDEWPDLLRDQLGLAHYPKTGDPEPVALCNYAVEEVRNEAQTGFSFTMPTVLDSPPWEHYFPAPKSLQFGRAMALVPCENDDDLKLEMLNSRVTYTPEHIWKLGQIVTNAPSGDIDTLRERHLLALQIASGDSGFGK